MATKFFGVNLFSVAVVFITTFSCSNITNQEIISNYSYEIKNTYPHNTENFTQGLFYDGNYLYEGTGLNGQSSIKKIDLKTGNEISSIKLDNSYFGEGITEFNQKIIQLTWQSGKAFVYDKNNFKLLKTFSYDTEGWGIAFDGKNLIMSDGSEKLFFRDPETFSLVKTIKITEENKSIKKLNELEYVNGEILANIWFSDKIAIINPENGKIKAWLDLDNLYKEDRTSSDDVLNGIAYNKDSNTLFVTGKRWNKVFELSLTSRK